jgi:chemotaxis protein MotB
LSNDAAGANKPLLQKIIQPASPPAAQPPSPPAKAPHAMQKDAEPIGAVAQGEVKPAEATDKSAAPATATQ